MPVWHLSQSYQQMGDLSIHPANFVVTFTVLTELRLEHRKIWVLLILFIAVKVQQHLFSSLYEPVEMQWCYLLC